MHTTPRLDEMGPPIMFLGILPAYPARSLMIQTFRGRIQQILFHRLVNRAWTEESEIREFVKSGLPKWVSEAKEVGDHPFLFGETCMSRSCGDDRVLVRRWPV